MFLRSLNINEYWDPMADGAVLIFSLELAQFSFRDMLQPPMYLLLQAFTGMCLLFHIRFLRVIVSLTKL